MKAIVNAKLVMEEGIIWDGVILWEGEQIVGLGWAGDVEIPEDAECMDAGGLYVAPGLIDIHNHGSVDLGGSCFMKIEKAILRLHEFPSSGSTPRYSVLKKQGYKVLIVDKHLVFYKGNDAEQIVTIYAIIDSRREYQKLL